MPTEEPLDENSKDSKQEGKSGLANTCYRENTSKPYNSERQMCVKRQMTAPERIEYNTNDTEIKPSRVNKRESTDGQSPQNIRLEGSVRPTRKYMGSRPFNRQKSMPEFDLLPSENGNPSTSEENHLERQNTMPEFTFRDKSAQSYSPKTDQHDLNKNLKCSSSISKASDPNESSLVRQEISSNKKHTSDDVVNYSKRAPFTRQKTMPEYIGTSSGRPRDVSSTRHENFNFVNEPGADTSKYIIASREQRPKNNILENFIINPSKRAPLTRQKTMPEYSNTSSAHKNNPDTESTRYKLSSREQNPIFERSRHQHQNLIPTESKSPLTHSVPTTSLGKSLGATTISSSLFTSATKPLVRQNSLPETNVLPKPKLDQTEMSISNDIQNRKLKYENDALDLNKQMRRQKAELRANGPGKSNWKPNTDTRSFTPNTGKSYTPHLQPKRPTQATNSDINRSQPPLRTGGTTQTRPNNYSNPSTTLVNKKPNSSLDSPRTSLRRNAPERKFSIDSAMATNPTSVATTTPKPTNWQDEARSQVWRSHMQRVKNLDRF